MNGKVSLIDFSAIFVAVDGNRSVEPLDAADLEICHDSNPKIARSICELIDGVLVEKAMATFEALVAGLLLTFINNHLADHDLGIALPPDGLLRLFPGRVRAPDVSFISWKRMPNSELPDEAIASLTPDLAVEVLSTTNTPAEIRMKIEEYFQAGSKLVWIVDPNARTVRVYTSPRRSVLLTEEDTLDGRKVLPGFSLPIREWFARASRRARR